MHWNIERSLTAIAALIFAGFGLWLIIRPEALAGIGIELTGASARTDVRATYGGFELGVAAFLCLCIARPSWNRVGLVAACLFVGGFGGGRLVGILLEGHAEPLMWGFVAIELVFTAVALWALRRPAGSGAA